LSFINRHNLDSTFKQTHEFVVSIVEKSDLLNNVSVRTSVQSLPSLNVPDNEHIFIVNTSLRSQILFISRKTQTLNEHFVQFEPMKHGLRLEVPDDDISLQTLMGFLATG
jgi:hypothetical protein